MIGLPSQEVWSPRLLSELERAMPALGGSPFGDAAFGDHDAEADDPRHEDLVAGGSVAPWPLLSQDDEIALPMNTLTSGRRRTYPNKSSFQAHVCCVMSPAQVQLVLQVLQCNAHFGSVRHWPYAYRIQAAPQDGVGMLEGFEDDGNDGAGEKMLGLLTRTGLENLMLIVSHWTTGPPQRLGAELFRCVHAQCKELLLDVQEAIHASFPEGQLLEGGAENDGLLPHVAAATASTYYGWPDGSTHSQTMHSIAINASETEEASTALDDDTAVEVPAQRGKAPSLVSYELPDTSQTRAGVVPRMPKRKLVKKLPLASWEDEATRLPPAVKSAEFVEEHLRIGSCALSARSCVDDYAAIAALVPAQGGSRLVDLASSMLSTSSSSQAPSRRQSRNGSRRTTRLAGDSLPREVSSTAEPLTRDVLDQKEDDELLRLISKMRKERESIVAKLAPGKAPEVIRKLHMPIYHGHGDASDQQDAGGGKMGARRSRQSRSGEVTAPSPRASRGRRRLLTSTRDPAEDSGHEQVASSPRVGSAKGTAAPGRSRLTALAELPEDQTFLTA